MRDLAFDIRRDGPALLLLLVVTAAVFLPVARHEFINYDDDLYVTENLHAQAGLSLGGVTWAFTTFLGPNWLPLTLLSHMVDCQLFGLNPAGHHLVNVLFHAVNACLLYWLLRRTTGACGRSLVVAALFALHPLHIQSVAWVAERKDVLSTFFWLLMMIAYVRYAARPRLSCYLATTFAFALGLMSKPMLVTAPFVLLLMDYWPLGRSQVPIMTWRRLVLEKVPWFVLAMASSIVTVIAQRSGGALGTFESIPVSARIENAALSYVGYIAKMLLPVDLAVQYPHAGGGYALGKVIAAGLVLAAVSFLVIQAAPRRPYALTGWLWYLGTLVPVIGIVQVGGQAMADRYTYVPLIGLFIILAWGIPDVLPDTRYKKAALYTVTTLVLVALAAMTTRELRYWRNSIDLFERTLAVTTDNVVAQYNLGCAYLDQKDYEKAREHFAAAVAINPNHAIALNNLGLALDRLGRRDEAAQYYTRALEVKPDHVNAYINLGAIYLDRGELDRAAACFHYALTYNPDSPDAQYNLGLTLYRQAKYSDALQQLSACLKSRPDHLQAGYVLALTLARLNRIPEAKDLLAQIVRIKPDYKEARQALEKLQASE